MSNRVSSLLPDVIRLSEEVFEIGERPETWDEFQVVKRKLNALFDIFDQLSDEEKKTLVMAYYYSRGSGEFADRIPSFLGEGFRGELQEFKRRLFLCATTDTGFAQGLAEGLCFSFHKLSDEDKERVLEIASRNPTFAKGLARLGRSFYRLPPKYKERLLDLAKSSPTFGYGFGYEMNFSKLQQVDAERVLEAMKANKDFARGVMRFVPTDFDSISDQYKQRLLKFAGDPDFAKELAQGFRFCFRWLQDQDKQRVLELAVSNDVFSNELRRP